MASYTQYIQQGTADLNEGYNYNLQQLIAQLGGLTNPTSDIYVPAEYRDVTDPTLRSITEYLNELGAEGYQYKYEDILKGLNDATNAAYAARANELADAAAQFNRDMAAQQESVADTIRNQNAQAIQSGVSRGMQSANILSSILGTTQAAAQQAQQLAQDRYQTGMDRQAQIIKDATDALNKSNAAYETLMGNIRQLFNDEIQEKTADLEYNASIADTNAQHAANRYTADTNYAQNIIGNASSIYNNNQSALANLINAAVNAAVYETQRVSGNDGDVKMGSTTPALTDFGSFGINNTSPVLPSGNVNPNYITNTNLFSNSAKAAVNAPVSNPSASIITPDQVVAGIKKQAAQRANDRAKTAKNKNAGYEINNSAGFHAAIK